MSEYKTHKSTIAGKRETIARNRRRTEKYATQVSHGKTAKRNGGR